MHGHRGPSVAALAAFCSLLLTIPLLVGQGCPGNNLVVPITGRLPNEDPGGVDGNVPPTFAFTSPTGIVQAEIGDNVVITWKDSDPDDNALIAILLDPDTDPNNGNEIPIQTNIPEDDPANSLTINTSNLSVGTYRIIARITDGKNPELVVIANGTIKLWEPGWMPINVSPSISVRLPRVNRSISQGDNVLINYCGNDRDGGEGRVVADVIILLDTDNDPLNDLYSGLDMTSADALVTIRNICSGTLPAAVKGGYVLGCAKDNKCTDPSIGTDFTFILDTTKIPQPVSGTPYKVRVDMWDQTNPPVHAYAAGELNISTLASGTVDLAKVGRQLAGTKFIGFDTGARAGFTGTKLGDYDSDGADDFIVVSRFGRGYERGNFGTAHLVYGTPGARFGSEVYLNSYGIEYRGCQFASGHTTIPMPIFKYGYDDITGQLFIYEILNYSNSPVTDGIVSVSYIESMNSDNKPEILFGLPYVEDLWDWHDDDPCDGNGCYHDGWPNPLRSPSPADNDDIGRYDRRQSWYEDEEKFTWLCANNDDPGVYTPLHQGHMICVSSTNVLEDNVIDLAMVGQHDPEQEGIPLEEGTLVAGSSAPRGARLRGGYYSRIFDFFNYELHPNSSGGISFYSYFRPPIFDRATQFAATVSSMPDLGNGGAIPSRDNRSEYLVSAPGGLDKRGVICMTWGQDLTAFCERSVKSIPDARAVGNCTRGFFFPDMRFILGRHPGDELGYASRAGDFNRDGHQDILCGSPGASVGSSSNVGALYILFGRLDFGHVDMSKTVDNNDPARQYVPRMEILGISAGDRFGETQTLIGDVNSDGFADVAFSAQYADGPAVDSGYVGIVFGGRKLTGENTFSASQVGTPQLPGVIFYGTQAGGRAGAIIADAGDFNHDGYHDLLICAPGETRVVDEQVRRGVAYLVFGGPHLNNGFYYLSAVGTSALPGIVFISPYVRGTADEAVIDWVGPAGDVDGDGFADVLIGLSKADFVNPLEPGQRRVDAGECYLVYGNNTGTNTIRK